MATLVALAVFSNVPSSPAQGIPEPSLVLYGTIRNTADNNIRMIAGTLSWHFRRTNTTRIVTVTAQVTNVLDQFSYVLKVPCETLVAGSLVSSNALDLTPSPSPSVSTFDRSLVLFGTNPVSFVLPSQASSLITSTNGRGRLERIDLTINIPFPDIDGNRISDLWETQYFGFIGVDPLDDADGDGVNNRDEFRAGTTPTDASSRFAFVNYAKHPSGGFQVQWSSAEGRFYVLQRASDLFGGFSTIRTNISATPPMNTYLDGSAAGAGPYFYRLRLE